MTNDIQTMREKICELGRMLFDRNLTDAAGGNISARMGDFVIITPRYAGAHFQWQLKPEHIIVATLAGKKLEGIDQISREAQVHLTLYQQFPLGNGVVHGHARNILAFCVAGIPIPPITESLLALGEIGFCDFGPAVSDELAHSVAQALHKKGAALDELAACVMAPWHGIFSLGKSIDDAYNAVERIDAAAYILLHAGALSAHTSKSPAFSERNALLKESAAKYGKSFE